MASNARFIYADHGGGTPKVANVILSGSNISPVITDFEIIRDTVYFCGYASCYRRSLSSTPLKNSYQGFIGHFCIPDLFDGLDGFHVLLFNNPSFSAGGMGAYINCPRKIEAFPVNNGTHIVCIGDWGTNDSTLGNKFVADIVHNYPTGKWWYYVQPSTGLTMSYSDIAVTDNYVAAVGTKGEDWGNRESTRDRGGYNFYLQLFHKPTSTSNTPLNTDIDHQIFQPRETTPLHNGYFNWSDDVFYSDLYIFKPFLTHTGQDFVAVSYLNYAQVNGQNMYGTTIKNFAIPDILCAHPYPIPDTNRHVTIDDRPPLAIASAPPSDPIGTIVPPVFPHELPPIPVQPRYNRMIRNQRASDGSVIGRYTPFALKDVVYNPERKQILCLQKHDYTLTMPTREMSVFAFYIDVPAADAIRYHRNDLPVLALSKGNLHNSICIAGGTSIAGNDNTLAYGLIPLESTEPGSICYKETDRYTTYNCDGHLSYDRNGLLPNPIYVRSNYAFSPLSIPAAIQNADPDVLCE